MYLGLEVIVLLMTIKAGRKNKSSWSIRIFILLHGLVWTVEQTQKGLGGFG